MNVVVGAGMGGLCAAIALARAGEAVTVIEASDRTGGLAGRVDLAGEAWDGGPYILLDRPGLSWVFRKLGADLDGLLTLLPLDEVYRVRGPDRPDIAVYRDLDRTAAALEEQVPGGAALYRAWVARMGRVYEKLRPLQTLPRPGPWRLIRRGLLRESAFLLRGLEHHVVASGLPGFVTDALGIWTHIAGQPLARAPAPLAFVPAIIHTHGAWTVQGGIHRIPEVLEALARAVGVKFLMGQRVERIVRDGRRVLGVEAGGVRHAATRVFSNASGLGTLLELLDPPTDPDRARDLRALPLQSPGVAAWLRASAPLDAPFLQFWVEPDVPAQMLVHPGAVDPTRTGRLRLVSPMVHDRAESLGSGGQTAFLEGLLAKPWWREGLGDCEVLGRRVPTDWGRLHHLYRDSMNPVMTARFMRQGRLAHRRPEADNLFLVGSATHPGQWVSFCAISGILAVEDALASG